jgi:tRNA threonylcarbamoyladenosine biosynthesis protein TsaE
MPIVLQRPSPPRPALRAALCAALAVFASAPAAAHPHVWIDAAVVPVFDAARRFVAVHEKWTLDQPYTESVLPELDVSRDGVIEPNELADARRTALWWMVNTYFTRITIGGRAVAAGPPADFAARLPFDRLIVEFTLPLVTPQPVEGGAGIDLYDPDNYFAIQFADPAIYPSLLPAACTAGPRREPNLDPTAVMILRQLGLTTDPAILNDPAAGFPFRVAIECK